jgi:phosphosulfolactate phosphohydrolase-like enzyme
MATLTIPRATWQTPPDSRITCIATNKEGNKVVMGMVNGTIVIFRWDSQSELVWMFLNAVGT